MRWGPLLPVVGLLGTGLLAVAALGPEPEGYWVPEGFVARADTLIDRGRLALRCGDQDSIIARFAPNTADARFYTLSYLRADVREFNGTPDAAHSPFVIEGCRLRGVDPFYHRIDLPFNRLPRWRGDVRFTFDGVSASLEGGPGQTLEVRHPVDLTDAARSARVRLDAAGARVSAPLLELLRPGSAEVLADAFFVGTQPVIAERIDVGSDDRLRVNGFPVPPGRMVRLTSGDWLEFELGGGRTGTAGGRFTYLTATGDRARTASFVRLREQRVDRLYPAQRLRPLVEGFSRAMDLALQSIPGGGDPDAPIATMDVRLTLDRDLHRQLEDGVVAWCNARRHPTRPRAVSMLVLDAFTGAVRAMPSCPGTDELAPYEPLSSRVRQSFLRNQNLVPHPVGSAAKPFWAAAVATTYPNFMDLRIPPHAPGPVDSALGCPLRFPYNDAHGSAQPVGLEAFIAHSCNRYLIEFATAALAVRDGAAAAGCRAPMSADRFLDCFEPAQVDGPSARLTICDRLVSTVLAPGLATVGRTCDDLQLVDAGFAPAPAFSVLTDVATYREPSPGATPDGAAGAPLNDRYRAERYRIDVWRRVLDQLRLAGDTADVTRTALRFSGVSPQSANLALNTVEQLRTDWINLLLGGENSRWSNFELAEALARLVSGRAVRGELVDSVGGMDADATGAFAPLPQSALRPGVRRRVLHAMELVAEEGTARRLAPAVLALRNRLEGTVPGHPYDLYVFAKTGTPAVEKFLSSAQQRLVQRLFAAGDLFWDAERHRFGFRPGVEARIRRDDGDRTLRWIHDDILAPMESDPAAFTVAPGQPAPEHPLYFDARGALHSRTLIDLRVDRQGGVLLLGLLAVPRDEGRAAAARHADWISACPLDPALRERILEIPPVDLLDPDRAAAITAAIYLDDLSVGEGSGFAVELAQQVFPMLGGYLEREVRSKATPSGT